MLWTEGQKRGLTINEIVRLISTNPAKLCGLDNKKGALKCGYDADFVVWNPNESFIINQKDIEHKNKVRFLASADVSHSKNIKFIPKISKNIK